MSLATDRIATAKAKLTSKAHAAPPPLSRLEAVSKANADAAVGVAADSTVATEVAASITENPFYKIVMDASKSNDQKIEELAKGLTAENGSYEEVRKRYADFEAYFNYVQSQNMGLNVQGINRLIKEIEDALKPQIEKIVTDVLAVQKGVDDSRQLLSVLRAARVENKTIDEISEAMKINDAILAEIAGITSRLAGLGKQEATKQELLTEKQTAKAASEKGFVNGMLRMFGPDKKVMDALALAEEQVKEVRNEMATVKAEMEAKQGERNQKLESGPLLILRSVDATEKSFSETLVATAKNCLKLIEGNARSVGVLLTRSAYSEAAAREINHNIAESEVREAILKGAVQQVVKTTGEQVKTIKAELDAKDTAIAATEKGNVQFAVLQAERVDVDQRHNGALDYLEVLNQTETSFATIAAGNVEAKTQANQLAALIHTEKDLLKRLGTEALPATALALRTVLETCVAQQNGELAITIGAITQKARDTGKEGLATLTQAQGELHKQKIQDMDRAIKALGDAQESVVQRIEDTVNEGIETRGRMNSLVAVSDELRAVLGELNEIRPSVTAMEKEADKAAEPAAKS